MINTTYLKMEPFLWDLQPPTVWALDEASGASVAGAAWGPQLFERKSSCSNQDVVLLYTSSFGYISMDG